MMATSFMHTSYEKKIIMCRQGVTCFLLEIMDAEIDQVMSYLCLYLCGDVCLSIYHLSSLYIPITVFEKTL